ncbi:peptide methionine sulfoxide reductase [Sneathia vaginalis]|uniref:Peptide methionine sulfoxide reductase MsrA n=1 Tax=Sneathia vaginalis TaxID=187101 RepID=A0A0E3UTK2_9FUSO|nr:peptide-methionine (S)-S-oxide reductase MsrA [Sneathia vaginalis]AKC95194.1 peptide methionine sulfoxide reductase [Sneathia vaginalis]
MKKIYLAAGCFWGAQAYFKKIDGVVNTKVGYANGKTEDTDYTRVSNTDHAETLMVEYDEKRINLRKILLHYFRIIDPTSVNRQGEDVGRQYRTGIYYTDENDKDMIDNVYRYYEDKFGGIVVEVKPLQNFILAEDYHQDYLDKNPNGYCHVDLSLLNLDEESYSIMKENNTERPFSSELNKENRDGIYVDKQTKEPLFSSKDKFDAGCGWPSFRKPIGDSVDYLEDHSYGMDRVEVRSKSGDNHLGHVFNEEQGLRYCINGKSLEFIPYEDMKKRGYEEYMKFVK